MIDLDHCRSKAGSDIRAAAHTAVGSGMSPHRNQLNSGMSAMRLHATSIALFLVCAGAASAQTLDPRLLPTEKEKAACEEDAVRLCSSAYPDATKMIDCMKLNRASLTPACLRAFDDGLKRRGL